MMKLRLMISRDVRHFVADEKGATAIEYAIIAAGISGTVIAVIMSMGTKILGLYQSVETALP